MKSQELIEIEKREKELKAQLKKLKNTRSINNKIRVDCPGPYTGKKCPDEAFKFFKEKQSWICNKCLKLWNEHITGVSEYYDESGKVRKGQLTKDILDYHTLYVVTGPNREEVRIGFRNKPLLSEYDEWWETRNHTPNNLPDDYYWCYSKHQSRKKTRKACKSCPSSGKCKRFQLDELKSEVKQLQKKTQTKKRRSREEIKLEKKRALEKALNKYKQERKQKKVRCSFCKKELQNMKYYYILTNTWKMTTPDKEPNIINKRACPKCKKLCKPK